MIRKRYIITVLLIVFAVAVNIGLFLRKADTSKELIRIEADIASDSEADAQLFYINDDSMVFGENQSAEASYSAKGTTETLAFDVPADTAWFRFDPSREAGIKISIDSIRVTYNGNVISTYSAEDAETKNVDTAEAGSIVTTSEDAYMIFSVDTASVTSAVESHVRNTQLILNIIECVVIDLIVLLLIIKWEALKPVPREIWYNRKLTLNLAKNDFKNRFSEPSGLSYSLSLRSFCSGSCSRRDFMPVRRVSVTVSRYRSCSGLRADSCPGSSSRMRLSPAPTPSMSMHSSLRKSYST